MNREFWHQLRRSASTKKFHLLLSRSGQVRIRVSKFFHYEWNAAFTRKVYFGETQEQGRRIFSKFHAHETDDKVVYLFNSKKFILLIISPSDRNALWTTEYWLRK